MSSTPNDVRNAELSYIYDLSGILNPTVDPIEASPGTTYKLLTENPRFFQKQDEGKTTNWKELSLDYSFQNVGLGYQIVKTVDQNTRTVEFRSLVAGSGVNITQTSNTLIIEAEVDPIDSIVTALIFG